MTPLADAREPEERHPHGGDWLRDVVLGLNDGLVTTLVFVMTLGGATGNRRVLVTSAFAELVAGGVSMAFGGFLSARADDEIRAARVATERHEIATEPEEERRELRAIYRRKGFSGRLLDEIVAHQTETPDRWLAAMLHDEHGMTPGSRRLPFRAGALVGASFMAGALVPIVPFLLRLQPVPAAMASYALTALAAMGLGALKARHTRRGALRSGLEFLALATAGALLGAAFGRLIARLR